MTFPSAYKGAKKLFAAQILELIGTVFLVAMAFMALMGSAAVGEGAGNAVIGGYALGTLLTLIPSVLLPIIAEIITLVGLYQAGKDDPQIIAKAFWLAVIALILSLVSAYVSNSNSNTSLVSILDGVGSVLSVLVFILTIRGFGNLCRRVGRSDVAIFGTRILFIMLVAVILLVVALIFAGQIGGIAALASAVVMAIVYIIYLVYLSKVKKALM